MSPQQDRDVRRFKGYPLYQNSGVDWLGTIPSNWSFKRLKDCVRSIQSGGTPESDNPGFWTDDDSGVPWVSIGDMTRSSRVRETAKRITEKGLRSKNLEVLPAGTLLYSMYASLGKVAVLEIAAVVNQAILGLTVRDSVVLQDYLRWWLEFMQGHITILSSTSTQDNLNADKVRIMPVYVPSLAEQKSIIGFLNPETARIDALVAKKERLIDLLSERCAASIVRAVTKGLNPNAPMKASGIASLGDIPAHWNSGQLARWWEVIDCKHRTVPFLDTGIALASIGEVQSLEVDLSNAKHTSWHEYAQMISGGRDPRQGDIIYSRNATVGAAALVATKEQFCMGQDVSLIRATNQDSLFLLFLLRSSVVLSQLEAEMIGSTFKRINVAKIKQLVVCVPPIDEQREIAAFCRKAHDTGERLIAKVREAIGSLTEYRSSLISAAVTGKIDVRQEVA